MKHFLWTIITTGLVIFNCTSSKISPRNDDHEIHLPGLPAQVSNNEFVEADGLIGVEPKSPYIEFYLMDSIRVVLDDPYPPEGIFDSPRNLILYALPNGNSIEWSMGKQKNETDDWHFNIQYIDAQIKWLRQNTPQRYTVAYLEAPQLSWPAWKRSHTDHGEMIAHVVDSLRSVYPQARVILNSHSGGGSFINGFIESQDEIPAWVQRIGFIDSNYGYDEAIGVKLESWLQSDIKNVLTVFAYNDSIALYEGKPFVSATGGTWYRSKMMIKDLGQKHTLIKTDIHKRIIQYRSDDDQILVLLKENPSRGIFHTEQVELNGLIHSLLFGSADENVGYTYFGDRCYDQYIQSHSPAF
ncbi:MAG: hypothetical protein HQ506_10750 [Candidatus Marinimicrobia bacterium]|nr:hypothetical protein [Candidatus Neomarinimicrobiota bacterium]